MHFGNVFHTVPKGVLTGRSTPDGTLPWGGFSVEFDSGIEIETGILGFGSSYADLRNEGGRLRMNISGFRDFYDIFQQAGRAWAALPLEWREWFIYGQDGLEGCKQQFKRRGLFQDMEPAIA